MSHIFWNCQGRINLNIIREKCKKEPENYVNLLQISINENINRKEREDQQRSNPQMKEIALGKQVKTNQDPRMYSKEQFLEEGLLLRGIKIHFMAIPSFVINLFITQ